jgi:hypothetical protein
LGLFDEELVRNQDDEFTHRVTQSGGRVWYDPGIRATYFSRASLGRLSRQYYQYGFFKILLAKKRGGLPSPRPLVPLAFVTALGATACISALTRRPKWVLRLGGAYALANAAISVRIGRRDNASPATLAAAFTALHLSYGVGMLAGVCKWRPPIRSLMWESVSDAPPASIEEPVTASTPLGHV